MIRVKVEDVRKKQVFESIHLLFIYRERLLYGYHT